MELTTGACRRSPSPASCQGHGRGAGERKEKKVQVCKKVDEPAQERRHQKPDAGGEDSKGGREEGGGEGNVDSKRKNDEASGKAGKAAFDEGSVGVAEPDAEEVGTDDQVRTRGVGQGQHEYFLF